MWDSPNAIIVCLILGIVHYGVYHVSMYRYFYFDLHGAILKDTVIPANMAG